MLPRFDSTSATPSPPPTDAAMVPCEESAEETGPTWVEPTTLKELNDAYVLEAKLAGKSAGTSLYVVPSSRRDGTTNDVQERQSFKLFLVARFCKFKLGFLLSGIGLKELVVVYHVVRSCESELR